MTHYFNFKGCFYKLQSCKRKYFVFIKQNNSE